MITRTLAIMAGATAFGGAVQAAPAVLVLTGTGQQVYVCGQAAGGLAWNLKAPDAVLTDASGKAAGRHFAGPSWQAADGSTVVGEVAATGAAPQPGDVPWLVLHAKSHAGSGVFAGVDFVVRSATQGGVAPAAGCDAAHAGAEARVDYHATYTFFSS